MTIDLADEKQIRAILTNQAVTAHALKKARARLVVAYAAEDMKSFEMWARIDLETADLAATAALADVEAKVLWARHGSTIVGEMRHPVTEEKP